MKLLSNPYPFFPVSLSFPQFSDCTFEWLYWSQSKAPFDARTLDYIAKLDADSDLATLAAHGWSLNNACKGIFLAANMLLKRGAAAGMTAYDIGSLMARSDFDQPSAMEILMTSVEERVKEREEAADGNGLLSSPSMFVALLSDAIDELIRPFAAAAATAEVVQE